MLADNEIDLHQSRLAIWHSAWLLDRGEHARHESSLVKTSVSEALFRVADRCVQVLGGLGVTRDTVVEQIFRGIRAFRIYDGPSEVHRWAIARRILRGGRDRDRPS
jgi:alkylation response protein AidB-like acyl-CoA dehydrogenase